MIDIGIIILIVVFILCPILLLLGVLIYIVTNFWIIYDRKNGKGEEIIYLDFKDIDRMINQITSFLSTNGYDYYEKDNKIIAKKFVPLNPGNIVFEIVPETKKNRIKILSYANTYLGKYKFSRIICFHFGVRYVGYHDRKKLFKEVIIE